MLIDYPSHKRWIGFTGALFLAALYVYLRFKPSANSVLGMWFGIAGAACMIFAGLLSVGRHLPSWWWLGSRKWWLKGHIWLGLFSGVLALFHSDCHWGGPLERILWIVLLLVLSSGVLGLLLQQVLPHLLAVRTPAEIAYEQIPRQCALLRRQADALIETVCGPDDDALRSAGVNKGDPKVDLHTQDILRQTYEGVVRPFLDPAYQRAAPLAQPAQADAVFHALRVLPGLTPVAEKVARLEKICKDRQQLGEQERLHHWLHSWLFLHIPLSVALLVVGVLHVILSLYY